MAPAIECQCGFKIKTANEPATKDQMEKLFAGWGHHTALIGSAIAEKITNSLLLLEPTEDRIKIHKAKIIYYEITPSIGFESAGVVK